MSKSRARYLSELLNSTGEINATLGVALGDNDAATFGDSDDLQIYHNANDSIVRDVGTGRLLIGASELLVTNSELSEAQIQSLEDGAVSLYYDGAAKLATTSSGVTVTGNIANSSGDMTLDVAGDIIIDADGGDIKLKDGSTHWASLYTNGTNTYLQSMVNSGDVYLSGKDGSGNGVNALILDMSAGGNATFSGNVLVGGSITKSGDLALDVSGDILLDADGGDIYFKDAGSTIAIAKMDSSNFTIQTNNNDKDIIFKGYDSDGGGLITSLTLDMSNGGQAIFNKGAQFSDHVYLGDNDHLVLGGGDDLRIYHDGSNNYVDAAGLGHLYIQVQGDDKDVKIRSDDGSGGLTEYFRADGSIGQAQLFYYGSKKLHTVTGGVDVTGTVTTDGLTVDGSSTAQINGSDSTLSGTNFDVHLLVGTTGGGVRLGEESTANDSFIGTTGTNDLQFVTYNGSSWGSRMTLTNGGNVGIGTSSPQALLHLNSASDTYFIIGTTNSTADGRIQFRNSAGTDAGGLWYNTSGNRMMFRTNSQERMRIDSSGRVGINTDTAYGGARMQICADDTSPSLNSTAIDDCTLILSNSDDDYGTVFATDGTGKGYIQQRRMATATYYDLSIQPHGSNVLVGTTSSVVDSSNTNFDMVFPDNGGIAIGSAYTFANIYGNLGNLYLRANAYPANTGSNATIYLQTGNSAGGQAPDVVVHAGSVGIGVSAPTSALDIRGIGNVDIMSKIINTGQTSDGRKTEFLFGKDNGANLSGVLKYVYDTTQADRRIDLVHYLTSNGISILDGGNVGIGTASPNSPLHVFADAGSSNSAVRIRNSNTTGRTTTLQLEDYSGALADGVLKFVFPNAGSTTGSYLGLLYNSAGLYVVPGGNVGIGLSSGIASKLHVNTEMSLGADADNRAIVGYTSSRAYIGTRQGGTNYFDTLNVTGGNVGIGTTSVNLNSTDIALQVGSGSYNNPAIQIRSSSTGTGRLWFGDNSGSDDGRADGYIQYEQGNRAMKFGTAQALRMSIDQYGQFAVRFNDTINALVIGGPNTVNGVAGTPSNSGTVMALGRDTGSNRSAHFAGSLKFDNGYGIDFGSTSNASGMTSSVLDDYEEGTWSATTLGGISVTTTSGTYTKIGRLVFLNADLTVATGSTSGSACIFTGLPFTGSETFSTGSINYTNLGSSFNDASVNYDTGNGGVTFRTNYNGPAASYANFAGKRIIFNLVYHTSS